MCLVKLLEESDFQESELDEMWSYVGKKSNPRWLWHGIDHRSGKVLGPKVAKLSPAAI